MITITNSANNYKQPQLTRNGAASASPKQCAGNDKNSQIVAQPELRDIQQLPSGFYIPVQELIHQPSTTKQFCIYKGADPPTPASASLKRVFAGVGVRGASRVLAISHARRRAYASGSQSVGRSVGQSVSQSIHPSIHPFIHPSIRSVSQSVGQSVSPSVRPPVRRSVGRSVGRSGRPSQRPSGGPPPRVAAPRRREPDADRSHGKPDSPAERGQP